MRGCCKTLIQSSLPSLHNSKPYYLSNSSHVFPFLPRALPGFSFNSSTPRAKLPHTFHIHSTPSNSTSSAALGVAISSESAEDEPQDDPKRDTVEHLLTNPDDISRLMKMERRQQGDYEKRWFPYLDAFKCGNGASLSSGQVLEAMAPYMMEERKERFRTAVKNRSYSVCLVVEGLNDFGNVSATFRSADALGFQSVHVINPDSSKRCFVG